MDSKDFVSLLNKMNNQELADYIQNNGKIKEPTSYDLPSLFLIHSIRLSERINLPVRIPTPRLCRYHHILLP